MFFIRRFGLRGHRRSAIGGRKTLRNGILGEDIMRAFLFGFLFIIGLLMLPCGAQCRDNSGAPTDKNSPKWLVYQYFVSDSFPDYTDYVTGKEQAEKPPLGQYFADDVDVSYRPLRRDSALTVYAVNATKGGEDMDMYCFMTKVDGRWKIKWVYALAMTGIYYMIVDSMSNMPEIPDSLRYLYENAKLVVSSDRELKEYLKSNIESFTAIKAIFDANADLSLVNHGEGNELTLAAIEMQLAVETDSLKKAALQKEIDRLSKPVDSTSAEGKVQAMIDGLWLNSVQRTSDQKIIFRIGGMVDNEVGYMYIPDGVNPPDIDAEPFIYVEEIIPHWYIYKTT